MNNKEVCDFSLEFICKVEGKYTNAAIKLARKNNLIHPQVMKKKMKAQGAEKRSRLYANTARVLKEREKETVCGEREKARQKKKERSTRDKERLSIC